MSDIWVCGLDDVHDLAERVRPARLISLLPIDEQPPTPLGVRRRDHLRLLVEDLERPVHGACAPCRQDVAALIRFLRASPPHGVLLIHCLAGVSRSTAAALVALVVDAPGRERDAALALRQAAPFASPNRLIVQLADEALQRRGALVEAVEALGDPTSLDLCAFRLTRLR